MSESSVLGLFDGVLARGGVRDALSDRAWLQAMLDVEAALARAEARAGIISEAHARAISAACRAENFEIAALGRDAAQAGNPVVPLVRALRALVGKAAADDVHRGATSQDILDSASMLVAKRALELLLEDLEGVAEQAARLAATHRSTLLAGRTLLQQALPLTFGLKAAGWLCGVDEARVRLDEVRQSRLAVQLGGAAGTLAAFDTHGILLLGYFAEELGLVVPVMPWHTLRGRVAELGFALGESAGAIGKAARDVILLAQTEVAEVREVRAGSGGSSSMPHKHNPIAAVSALAAAQRAPGLVSTLLTSMVQEHERAAGAWHAEWRPLSDLFIAVGSAASWLRECLEHLEPDPQRMRANMQLTGGAWLAERVSAALTSALGKEAAHEFVARACAEVSTSGRALSEILAAHTLVQPHLSRAEIDRLLDPSTYLGSTSQFIDRALAAHQHLSENLHESACNAQLRE